MALGHERLDVYRLAIAYVAWVYEKSATLEGVHRAARDQWLRASQSIPLNIAEGNGKTADADRRRYFEIGRVRPWNAPRYRTLGENIEIAVGIAIGIEHLARPSRKQNTGNRQKKRSRSRSR